jgi:general secretion pathway protein J
VAGRRRPPLGGAQLVAAGLTVAGAALNRQDGARLAGFTLLEVIVALAVFGFLFIALNAGTRTGFALWNAQTRRVAQSDELDATVRVLRTMLSEIPLLPIAATQTVPQAIAIKGDSDQLVFVGNLPTGLGAVRLADIALKLKGGRLVIDWTPHRHVQAGAPPVTPTETALLGGVEGLELAYFGADTPRQPGFWHAKWTAPGLPELIRVRLRFGKRDPRRWPELIVAPQLAPP